MSEPRKPRVWVDEDVTDPQPGDFFLDIMGTWIIEPDGSWRGYHQLTQEELDRLSDLIAESKNQG